MNNLPTPATIESTIFETLTPEVIESTDYAYYRDGEIQVYGPAYLVVSSLENHFAQARRQHYANIIMPWNRMFILITTGFTMDQFDWAEKIVENATKMYTYIFG